MSQEANSANGANTITVTGVANTGNTIAFTGEANSANTGNTINVTNAITFRGGVQLTLDGNATIPHIINPQNTAATIILKPGKSFIVATQQYHNNTDHDMIFTVPPHSEDVVLLAEEQPAQAE